MRVNEYENTKATVHYLEDLGCARSLGAFIGANVDFRNPRLQNSAVIGNLHALLVCLDKFRGAIDNETLQIVLFEEAKFFMPLGSAQSGQVKASTGSERFPPWLFEKGSANKVRWLLTKMGKGVVPEEVMSLDAPTQGEEGDGCSREKMWLDDVISALESVYDNMDEKPEEAGKVKVKAILISLALQFCWTGNLTLNGKTINAWSVLRSELKDMVMTAHRPARAR